MKQIWMLIRVPTNHPEMIFVTLTDTREFFVLTIDTKTGWSSSRHKLWKGKLQRRPACYDIQLIIDASDRDEFPRPFWPMVYSFTDLRLPVGVSLEDIFQKSGSAFGLLNKIMRQDRFQLIDYTQGIRRPGCMKLGRRPHYEVTNIDRLKSKNKLKQIIQSAIVTRQRSSGILTVN